MKFLNKLFSTKQSRAPDAIPEMEYTTLGSSGMSVSRICLGTMSFGVPEWQQWTISKDAARPIVRRAIELGINFIDTADVYSNGVSEEIVGDTLYEFAPRDEIVLATKVNGPMGPGPNRGGLSRKHIVQALDASLGRLRTDYVDLYQIHRWDYNTSIEETLETLNDLVRAGKVRYIGASSMFAWEFSRALHVAERNHWARFVSMQNHYNLVYREEEREMLPLCRHEGIAILPWSPLARGLLAGGKKRQTIRATTDEYATRLYYQPCDMDVAERTARVARDRGAKPAQVALAWLLARPGVTSPVVGVTQIAHLEEAVGALNLELSAEEMKLLEEPYRPHPVLGHP